MRVVSSEPVRLTELTSCGGCAAKWGASLLGELVAAASIAGAPALWVGWAPSDEAAVVQAAEGVALVWPTAFSPPLVDDPADFGAIAAANACSDVFAMGGDVVLALNIAAFPESLPAAVIQAIFRAAAEVVVEAGGVVAGGHTIRSPEPIFGLAVQGVVVPGEQFPKGGARPDDVLVLSKPLGTGLALASGDPQTIGAAISTMRQLNRLAAGVLRRHCSAVHAVTDVTGFGLLGHGWEVAERSDAHLVFDASSLPLIDGVLAVAEAGGGTGGGPPQPGYVGGPVAVAARENAGAVGFDPQTSGGLLAAGDLGLVDATTRGGFLGG